MTAMPDDIPIMRVPISLPCQALLDPDVRSERCAVDAWWVIGRASICTFHLRKVLGDNYDAVMNLPEDFEYNPTELLPWDQMYRYSQEQAQPDWPKS